MKASFSGATSYPTQAAGALASCPVANFPSDPATVARLTPVPGGVLTCYQPGIYTSQFTAANKDVAYLMPGVTPSRLGWSFEEPSLAVSSTVSRVS